MYKIMLIFVLAGIASIGDARTLDRCGIARELRNHGFPEDLLNVWVCVIEKESSGRTHIVGKLNKNGSRDYGLFQINDMYWCSNTSVPGKDCNVTCDELTTDDITKAAKCAKLIYKRHKFSAWYGYDHCQEVLPDISDC